MSLKAGRTVFVLYNGHPLWHERLLLAPVGSTSEATSWIIYTPDGDLYLEDFAAQNNDIDEVKFGALDNSLPRGVPAGEVYRFAQLPDAKEMRPLQQEARELADAEVWRRGGVTGEVEKWYSMETKGSVKKGEALNLSAGVVTAGDKGIFVGQDGAGLEFTVFMKKVLALDLPSFKKELEEEDDDIDARILPIRKVGDKRVRDFKDAVGKLDQVTFEDWPVPGPRTVVWCMKFLASRGGPAAHHQWWRTTCKLGLGDYGVAEHDALMRGIQEGLCYDQMDVSNIAFMEHGLRRAQLIAYHHRELSRLAEEAGGGGKTAVDGDEARVFLGTTAQYGNVMICPELVSHVSKELERQSSIDKQARKAREERALKRK